jgi:thiopeptide-type bacteriocin biosynthesis protein
VEAASPDLARQVGKILHGEAVPGAALRRAVISTLRYLLRAQTRATPFGLLAGIAPARVGQATAIRAGDQHRCWTRADAAWIDDMASRLEADPAVLPQLQVVSNSLAVRRGQYVVIECRAGNPADGTSDRVQVRATAPVLAILELAAQSVPVADLTSKLAASFRAIPDHVIGALIVRLIGERYLLTSLRPATTDADPLAAALRVLDALCLTDGSCAAIERARLHEIHAALSERDAAPDPSTGCERRSRIVRLMGSPSPLATDLRIDWTLTIPRAVADEAASAAAVLARLARRPALSPGWNDWHALFLDRYGPGAAVPVLDAVDDSVGLGYPAGYLGSPYLTGAAQFTDRDKALLKIAHTAAVRRTTEVTLDDEDIRNLSVLSPDGPVQPSAEITARLHALSTRRLDQGDFELHVTGASRSAGTIAGRFLSLLEEDERDRVMCLYAAAPDAHLGALTLQLVAAPAHARTGNVVRAARMPVPAIFLGEYHDAADGGVPLTDLAVIADARRLHLISISRARPVRVVMLNAVDLGHHAHPLARFLIEASSALAAPCAGFDWGAAHVLPFLPAVRHGRAILAPARWHLQASDLPAGSATDSEWDTAFAAWRQQVALADWVALGAGDQCIRLYLAEPSHRALVREELRRSETVMLRSAPSPDVLGWAGGRVHEVVIPVRATRPVRPIRWAGEVSGRRHGFVPMQDGRLYLQLHGTRSQQDTVLTRHMPDLQQRLGSRLHSCWFIRYDQPGEHLRLRMKVGAATSAADMAQVAAWSEDLREGGLITGVSWQTYYPETTRFGGTAVLDAAEDFFSADSAAVIAQLAASSAKDGPDPRAVTAAGLVDLTVGLIGDETAAMHWLVEHTATSTVPPPRSLYKQALTLAAPGAVSADIACAWERRKAAAATYRELLSRVGTVKPDELLPDLLHLHHARMAGPDIAAERTCLHLARAAALSRIARARKK